GYVTFNDLDGLRERVALAVRQARLVGSERTILAPVEPVVAIVPPELKKDPTAVPLAEKRSLLEEYNEILRGHPRVSTSSVRYGDSRRRVVFATSEGAYIEQTKSDVTLGIRAIARDGSDVQQAGLSLGANGDFAIVEGRHAE